MNAFGKCKGGGRRSSARERAPLIAVFSTLARSHDSVLVDISRTGARLSGDDLPELGEEFILTIEGIRAFGSVVWSAAGQCGVVFDGPLPAGDVESVRHKVSRLGGFTPRMKAAFDDWMLGFAR
jgi:hypothetical protein